MRRDGKFRAAQKYLKERIKVKEVLRRDWAKKSIEEKMKDVLNLRKFFGR